MNFAHLTRWIRKFLLCLLFMNCSSLMRYWLDFWRGSECHCLFSIFNSKCNRRSSSPKSYKLLNKYILSCERSCFLFVVLQQNWRRLRIEVFNQVNSSQESLLNYVNVRQLLCVYSIMRLKVIKNLKSCVCLQLSFLKVTITVVPFGVWDVLWILTWGD